MVRFLKRTENDWNLTVIVPAPDPMPPGMGADKVAALAGHNDLKSVASSPK